MFFAIETEMFRVVEKSGLFYPQIRQGIKFVPLKRRDGSILANVRLAKVLEESMEVTSCPYVQAACQDGLKNLKLIQLRMLFVATSKQEQRARELLVKQTEKGKRNPRLIGKIAGLNAENRLLEELIRDISYHPEDTGLFLRNATRSILATMERHSIELSNYPKRSDTRYILLGEIAARQQFYGQLDEIKRGI